MNILHLKQVVDWLFPPHAWAYNETEDRRACAVCGQIEEFDQGSGFAGSAWFAIRRGDRAAHVRALPTAAQPQPVVDDSEYAVVHERAH